MELAEWNLVRLTPSDWLYGGLPYATTTRGEVGGFADGDTIQPDKAAFFGVSLFRLWRVTGDPRYRDAAFRIGETLLATQRPDGSWYFRVHPRTGEALQPYSASIMAPLRLLDVLEGDERRGRFTEARDAAFDWLLENPVRTEEWVGYYEDVAPDARSYDQWMPEEAILYCLDHLGERPGLLDAATRMEAYVERTYLAYYGVLGPGVREQTHCFVPMNAHSLHWALAAFDLAEATGNELLRRAARSAVNTTTWNQAPDGRSLHVNVFNHGAWQETWYSLAFSPLTFALPYMSRCPETAPADENHLLRHSAAICSIRYLPDRIDYETDAASEDLFRLKDTPTAVVSGGRALPRGAGHSPQAPGWSWREDEGILRVSHPGGIVLVELASPR
jgi:rhamnogalacturonyl hydrolase YesR